MWIEEYEVLFKELEVKKQEQLDVSIMLVLYDCDKLILMLFDYQVVFLLEVLDVFFDDLNFYDMELFDMLEL